MSILKQCEDILKSSCTAGGATAASIMDAQRELDVVFPASYQIFYLTLAQQWVLDLN